MGAIDETVVSSVEGLEVGSRFHRRYRIERLIKSGGMGAVYEVIDLETRRRRALKTMLPAVVSDPDLRERFRREATIAADIQSDHLVEIFDARIDRRTKFPFLVMELLKGEDIGSLLARTGRRPFGEVAMLISQAALALEKTQAAGIVHRDLKPENLFLTTRDDGTPRLKVLDFGIAKVVAQSTRPETTLSFGTPMYMSPEQIRGAGDIDGRADLYALGQITYTLLAGRPFWTPELEGPGHHQAVLYAVTHGARESAVERASRLGVELPAEFDPWFSRAAAVSPRDRFDTATEMAAGLRSILQVSSGATVVPSALGRANRSRATGGLRRRRSVSIAVAFAAMLVVGVTLLKSKAAVPYNRSVSAPVLPKGPVVNGHVAPRGGRQQSSLLADEESTRQRPTEAGAPVVRIRRRATATATVSRRRMIAVGIDPTDTR